MFVVGENLGGGRLKFSLRRFEVTDGGTTIFKCGNLSLKMTGQGWQRLGSVDDGGRLASLRDWPLGFVTAHDVHAFSICHHPPAKEEKHG